MKVPAVESHPPCLTSDLSPTGSPTTLHSSSPCQLGAHSSAVQHTSYSSVCSALIKNSVLQLCLWGLPKRHIWGADYPAPPACHTENKVPYTMRVNWKTIMKIRFISAMTPTQQLSFCTPHARRPCAGRKIRPGRAAISGSLICHMVPQGCLLRHVQDMHQTTCHGHILQNRAQPSLLLLQRCCY